MVSLRSPLLVGLRANRPLIAALFIKNPTAAVKLLSFQAFKTLVASVSYFAADPAASNALLSAFVTIASKVRISFLFLKAYEVRCNSLNYSLLKFKSNKFSKCSTFKSRTVFVFYGIPYILRCDSFLLTATI